MPGRRLTTCCQELVSHLLVYFEQEKKARGPLLTVDAVHERVANALGISIKTVFNIKHKNKATPAVPSSSTATALYKPRAMPKTRDVAERVKMDVRKVIYEMYQDKKHVTIKSLREVLKCRNILETSSTSLRRLLHGLGFKFKKDDNRRALMEKNDIAALRFSFLRKYQTILSYPLQRDVVFLDETWIFAKGSQTKSWQDDNIKSVRKPEGYDGKWFIVLHAGTRNGFISNANLIFSSKSSTSDYHGEMNSDLFKKWVKTQLIPNLEEPSLILMDNAPYHSVLLEKSPNQSWSKGDIITWLNNNQIPYETTMNKNELLEITKKNKKEKVYVIDELLREHGHEVLRIPPYHCDFNAIELIWARAKGYYNNYIGRDRYGDAQVLNMWQESLDTCTPDIWRNCVDHTEKLIKEWYEREAEVDDFILTVNCGSEDESEDTD